MSADGDAVDRIVKVDIVAAVIALIVALVSALDGAGALSLAFAYLARAERHR